MTQHSTYLASKYTGTRIEQYDRARYEAAKNGSENLRRALLRFYFKRNNWQ